MKALVTGGAGFIGSHLVDRLISIGIEAVVIDDTSNANLAFLNPKARFYKASIEDFDTISAIFDLEKPEIVFHLAAKIDVASSVSNPSKDAYTNVIGTVNVALASSVCSARKLVFSSSAAVYGIPEYLPVDESHPLKPLSPYGTSKATAEWYLWSLAEVKGFEYTILRFSNVYGPRQGTVTKSGLVSILIRSFLTGEQAVLYSPETTTRDYVYVDDVVEALVLCIEKGSGEVFNISSNTELTNLEIYEKVCRYVKGEIEKKPLRQGEIDRIRLDNSKALNLLGWKPETEIDEGIEKTYIFFKQWMGV